MRVRRSDLWNWFECSLRVYLTEHIHSYTHGVAQYSSSMHKLLCVCGNYLREAHITDPTIIGRYKNCTKCGYLVDTGGNITIQPVQCINGGKEWDLKKLFIYLAIHFLNSFLLFFVRKKLNGKLFARRFTDLICFSENTNFLQLIYLMSYNLK